MARVVVVERRADELAVGDGHREPRPVARFPAALLETPSAVFEDDRTNDPKWLRELIEEMPGMPVRMLAGNYVEKTALRPIRRNTHETSLIIHALDPDSQRLPFELASRTFDVEEPYVATDRHSIARAYHDDLGTDPVLPDSHGVPFVWAVRGARDSPPSGSGWSNRDVEYFSHVENHLQRLASEGVIRQRTHKVKSIAELRTTAGEFDRRPDVLILVAHGHPDGSVALGTGAPSTAADLADVIVEVGVRIVVLGVCHAGEPANESALARQLIDRDDPVPIVVAPRGQIRSDAMQSFVGSFVDRIGERKPIDRCVASGLGAVGGLRHGQLLFFTSTSNYDISAAAHVPPRRRVARYAAAGVAVLALLAGGFALSRDRSDEAAVDVAGDSTVGDIGDAVASDGSEAGDGADQPDSTSVGDPEQPNVVLDGPPEGFADDPETQAEIAEIVDARGLEGGAAPTAEELVGSVTPEPAGSAKVLADLGQAELASDSLARWEPSSAEEAEQKALQQAEALVGTGTPFEYRAAYDVLIQAIRSGVDSESMQAKALSYQLQFEPDEAALRIRELAAGTDNGDVKVVEAQWRLSNAQFELAIEAAAQAKMWFAQPDNSSATGTAAAAAVEAEAHIGLEDWEAAVTALEEAESADPPLSPDQQLALVNALARLGADDDIDEALMRLEELSAIPAYEMISLRKQGELLVDRNAPQAVRLIRDAIALEDGEPDRERASNRLSLASALVTLEPDDPEIEEVYDEAIAIAPDWHLPLREKAEYLARGDVEREPEALELLRVAVGLDDAPAEAFVELCDAEFGDDSEPDDNLVLAEQPCRVAYEMDPTDVFSISWYGYVSELGGNEPLAERLYREALDLEPEDRWVNDRVCVRLADADEVDLPNATEQCERALVRTTNANIAIRLAELYEDAGRVGTAEETLRDALERFGSTGYVAQRLASLLERLPGVEPDEALDRYRDADQRLGDEAWSGFVRSYAEAALATEADDVLADELYERLDIMDDLTATDLVNWASAQIGDDVEGASALVRAAVDSDPIAAHLAAAARGLPDDLVQLTVDPFLDPSWTTYDGHDIVLDRLVDAGACDAARMEELIDQFLVVNPEGRRSYVSELAWCHRINEDLDSLKALAAETQSFDDVFGRYVLGRWYYLALHELDVDDPEVADPLAAASETLEQVISAEPDLYLAHDGLLRVERPGGAERLLQLKAAWARMFAQFGEWEDGLQLRIEDVERIDPNDPDLDEWFEDLMTKYPDSAWGNARRGLELHRAEDSGTDDLVTAAEHLRRAVAGASSDPQVYFALTDSAESDWEAARLASAAAALWGVAAEEGAYYGTFAGNKWFDVEEWERAEAAYLNHSPLDDSVADSSEYAALQLLRLYLRGFDHTRQPELLPYLDYLVDLQDDPDYEQSDDPTLGYERIHEYWLAEIVASPEGLPVFARLVEVLAEEASDPPDPDAVLEDVLELVESAMIRWPTEEGYRVALDLLDRMGL